MVKQSESTLAGSRANALRQLLAAPGIVTMPCCFDALSAKLIEQAGFPLTFMSGFAVAAARLGAPDTGLISYAEMLDQGRNICDAVSIPVIGDADTGYGNAMNVKRTVAGYARAGFACAIRHRRRPYLRRPPNQFHDLCPGRHPGDGDCAVRWSALDRIYARPRDEPA